MEEGKEKKAKGRWGAVRGVWGGRGGQKEGRIPALTKGRRKRP